MGLGLAPNKKRHRANLFVALRRRSAMYLLVLAASSLCLRFLKLFSPVQLAGWARAPFRGIIAISKYSNWWQGSQPWFMYFHKAFVVSAGSGE
jgi:hypothetical protein